MITYDLESIQFHDSPKIHDMLVKYNLLDDKVYTENLKFTRRHVAVLCSIVSNVPGFETAVCIISEEPTELCRKMFEYFDIISEEASRLMKLNYDFLYQKITDQKDLNSLNEYIQSIPVGFNSSFYDIGLLAKEGFIHEIYKRDNKPFIIKSGTRYKVIKISQFIFLDQICCCAAGTRLSSFIKAYGASESKGYFSI